MEKKWYLGEDIKKCNTARRDTYCRVCFQDEEDMVTYDYYQTLVDNYPKLQNNDKCVSAVYNAVYEKEYDDYHDLDDSSDFTPSLVLVAIYILA